MDTNIIIEDHVVPQLFTSAIEAYEIEHKAHKKGRSNSKLETFGLLWGYSISSKGDLPARIVATMATVETSAIRHQDWVEPDLDSIINKKAFFEKYWPNIELVGTFHSHPYENLNEVKKIKGWRASTGNDSDETFWPWLHQHVSPEQAKLAHIIVAITKLDKKGWAYPDRLQGGEKNKGYVLSADNRKLWLRAYLSESTSELKSNDSFYCSESLNLNIPSLQNRFW